MIYPGQLINFERGNDFPVKQQLLSLFSYLKAHGVGEIEILDLGVEIGEDIKAKEDVVEFERRCVQLIGGYKFDIVCISCFTTFNYTASVLVGKLCREINPNANIIVGGWHGQLCPEDFLESKGIFDFLVVGQGEKILLDIAKGKIEKNDEKTRLVYGKNLVMEDYNTFDYEFSDYILHCQSVKNTENITTIEFNLSQQCPYDCSFCANNLLDNRKWVAFSVEKSLKQIDRAISVFENLKVVTIHDPVFGFEKKWRRKFLKELVNRKYHVYFMMQTRLDIIDEEDIELLSKINFFICFGVEALSIEVLRAMQKTNDPDRYIRKCKENLNLLKKYNIPRQIYLLLGHPGETDQTLRETYNNLKQFLDKDIYLVVFPYYYFLPNFINNFEYYTKKYGSLIQGNLKWWKGYHSISEVRYVPSSGANELFEDAYKNHVERINYWGKRYYAFQKRCSIVPIIKRAKSIPEQ